MCCTTSSANTSSCATSRGAGDARPDHCAADRLLKAFPHCRFDTDYVEARRVHRALAFIEWERVRYSVPTACLGQLVEVSKPVDSNTICVLSAGRVVTTQRLASDGTVDV